MTHVVLGATGASGIVTVEALLKRGFDVVSVARSAQPTQEGVRTVRADLLDADQTRAAVSGAEIAYLTVGLPYSTRVWRAQWPVVMANTVAACLAAGTPLVFLDNVYAYGPVDGPMTEDTPYRPSTRKGRIRLEVIRMLEAAAERGLRYSIVRSADFYGPGVSTSVFTSMVTDNVAAGKSPVWMFDATTLHSMTYVPDLGRALAAVGSAFTAGTPNGQVWHAPTAMPALTGEQYMVLASRGTVKPRTMSMPMMRLGGLFVPAAREAIELAYQSTRDYIFDSSRFEAEFGIAPTSYETGIAATLDAAHTSG